MKICVKEYINQFIVTYIFNYFVDQILVSVFRKLHIPHLSEFQALSLLCKKNCTVSPYTLYCINYHMIPICKDLLRIIKLALFLCSFLYYLFQI